MMLRYTGVSKSTDAIRYAQDSKYAGVTLCDSHCDGKDYFKTNQMITCQNQSYYVCLVIHLLVYIIII